MELCVEHLSCAKDGVVLLEGLSFKVSAGQALVLRGDNGIGKTTLLRLLAGLIKPLAGKVKVGQDDLVYGAHLDGVKTALTVTENLHFWAMVYGQTDIVHALSVMNLKTLHDRFAAHLSAGQKRRLGLARFLVTGCKIWIMDEPTVSLDASSTELFQNMLSTHLASGGIAVIATHIELGLIGAMTLDLNQYRANIETQSHQGAFDEAMI